MVGLMLQDTLWRDKMYIEIKEQIKFMNDIVTRDRKDIQDYQKDMCMLAFIVGKINGLIYCFENNNKMENIKKAEE